MRKNIFIIFIILIIVALVKYFSSDYKIEYELGNHKIETNYSNGRYYIEIDGKYNFDIYKKRGLSKLKISNIIEINSNSLNCVYPDIKGVKTNPLCYYNGEYTDYNLIDSDLLNKYKTNHIDYETNDTFSYNKSLEENEYVMLWNYKGLYEMNYDKVENISILNKDEYNNSLMYQIDNKIFFPDYDQDYLFKNFYIFNIDTSKYKKIETKFEISYDSYIVGNIKNKIYLYDIKNSNLYEINIKNSKINLICSKELGYFKYDGKKKINVDKSEFDNKNITYNKDVIYNYEYKIENNIIYKIYKDNFELKNKIYTGNNLRIIDQNEDNLYFISGDILYKYSPTNGVQRVFNYFELNFNQNNIIYTYIK